MSVIIPITTFTVNGDLEVIGRVVAPVVDITAEITECEKRA